MRLIKRKPDGLSNEALIVVYKTHFIIHITERQKKGELQSIKMGHSNHIINSDLQYHIDGLKRLGFIEQ